MYWHVRYVTFHHMDDEANDDVPQASGYDQQSPH